MFAGDKLVEGFKNPPDEAKLWAYWWWLNGNVTEAALTRDLRQMKKKGFGGVVLFDADGSHQGGHHGVPAGPTFASPEWTRLFVHTIKEAERLGLSVSLNIQSGWNLGGPGVTAEHAAKKLVYSTANVEGGKNVEIELPKPEEKHGFYRDIAVVAFRKASDDDASFKLTASSSQENHPVELVTDDSAERFWVSGGRNPGEGPTKEKPQWLEYRFKEPVEIDRFELLPRPGYGPKQCELVAYESDSDQGGTVATSTPADSGTTSIKFSKRKVVRVRLNIFASADPAHPNRPRNVQVAHFSLHDGEKRITGRKIVATKLHMLDVKSATREFGWAAPDCSPLMKDEAECPGEAAAGVSDVLVLSDKTDQNGRLNWNAPEGDWIVLRFGYTATGARVSTSSGDWQGLVLDYLSREAFEDYWAKIVEPLLDAAGDSCGRSLRYLHTDSWEAGGMNWTDDFREEFEKRRGYDPIPYLPVLAGYILDDRKTCNRFLNDFRRTIGDLIADNHYGLMKTKAAKRNLGIHPESGGPHGASIDSLQLLGISDIPMSEFWSWSPQHRIGDANRFFTKQPASAAHTNGRKLVAAEGFTNIGLHWQESFSHNLKPSFDQAVCEGMNLLVWHAFICSPEEQGFPGQEYFAGTHFNPNNFVWQKSDDFLAYINRVHFLLQQGLPAADVLEYYGENVPNFTQGKGANTARSLPGYDYDVASESVLLDNVVGVRDGKIVLKDGMNYRVLVLPNRPSISGAALRKIEKLVDAGATVIGPKPERTTGLDPDPELKKIVAKLWDGGKIIADKTANARLSESGVPPDFKRIAGSNPKPRLDWIHRTVYGNQVGKISLRKFAEFSPLDVETIPVDPKSGVGAEIYYVANLSGQADRTECSFRVVGRQPELWCPLSGEIRDAKAFKQDEATTTVPLDFAPFGSMFVVFRKEIARNVQGKETSNELTLEKSVDLTGSWNVRFDSRWGGPENPVEFKNLESWTGHDNSDIRHYSGIAVYFLEIDVETAVGRRVFLEFGNVREIAEVKVNGKSCGSVWAAPFRLELTAALKSGKNQIEVEVANHWANRVIGDAAKPETERLTRTNIKQLTPKTPLVESGLIGPARILYFH